MKFKLLVLVSLFSQFLAAQTDTVTLKDKIFGEKKMPALSISDVDGKKVNVNELHKDGKYTVVSFWATWCVPCKKELNNIADIYEEWQKKYNVKLVAISIDDSRSAPKVKPYIDGQRWDYTVLLDVNSDVKRALNIQNVPYTMVLDKDGKVIYEHSGYQEGAEHELEEFLEKLPK